MGERRPLKSCFHHWPTRTLCILIIVLQAVIINWYLMNNLSNTWAAIYGADAVVICLFVLAFFMASRNINIEKHNHDAVFSDLQHLPLTYIAWFVYTVVLDIKISVIFSTFSTDLDEKYFFGPNTLKTTLPLTGIVFMTFLPTLNDIHMENRKNLIVSLTSTVIFDILDGVDNLENLFDKDVRDTYPSGLDDAIIAICCINFLLPTVPLFTLAKIKFGLKKLPIKLELLHKIAIAYLVNLPLFITRMITWHGLSQLGSIFLLKNVLAMGVVTFEVCEKLCSSRKKEEEHRSYSRMYRVMSEICSSKKRASGPATDAEHVLADQTLSEYCLDAITRVPRKQFSRYVSKMMDRLGYSYTMIKERQRIYDENDKSITRKNDFIRVTTGGKGEGTALLYESDTDFMFVINNIICTNRPQEFMHNNSRNITLFQTEMYDTSPGYTRLKLVRLREDEHKGFRDSLFVADNGSHYISSNCLNYEISASLRNISDVSKISVDAISGPSTPFSTQTNSCDTVHCFTCICDEYLESWVSRPRYHGWPSPATIDQVSKLDGHVVPVGFKGSDKKNREWRICYSLAELHLMRTLNECQLKVYVILKKISKLPELQTVCKDITSYIMKNVVFWVSEINGVERFTEELLIDRLIDCIRYLLKCVSVKTLPSYMIPERNLFASRLDVEQRHQLTSLLCDLLDEGGKMLLRCARFRETMIIMYTSPDMLREFAEIRDKVESLDLMKYKICLENIVPTLSFDETRRLMSQNGVLCLIDIHVDSLTKFKAPALRQIGKTDKEIDDLKLKRLKGFLS